MTSAAPLSVGILGLGQIAQGYDDPDKPAITTHIKACLDDPRLRVAWIADADSAQAAKVKQKWNLRADIVAPATLLAKRPDILCIATPDDTHAVTLHAAFLSPPRLILCEKPLALTLDDARAGVAAGATAGTPIAVNFMRRALPGVAAWLAAARSGAWAAPLAARLTYCRGLRHNACHGFDLIGAAFGAEDVAVSDARVTATDFSESDPTVSAAITLQSNGARIPIALTGVDRARLLMFEVDILFTEGRLRIWNEQGLRLQIFTRAPSSAKGVAPELHCQSEFHDHPARHLALVWRNLADHLLAGAPLLCPAADTLNGMALVEAVASAPRAFARE